MRTRKSLKKRFKITRKGKVIYRAPGQDHFRAKKSGAQKRKKRTPKVLPKTIARQVKKAINR